MKSEGHARPNEQERCLGPEQRSLASVFADEFAHSSYTFHFQTEWQHSVWQSGTVQTSGGRGGGILLFLSRDGSMRRTQLRTWETSQHLYNSCVVF